MNIAILQGRPTRDPEIKKTDRAKALMSEEKYRGWLSMNAEEFANNTATLAMSLRKAQKLLKG